MNPKHKTKQYELFEPVKVFIALMLVAIVWLLPVAFPQAEDSPDKKPNTDSPFIVPKAGAGWTCFDNPNCWIWACAEKVPGGGCNAWEQKCTCSGGGGGGGPSYSPPTISHTFNCSVSGWGDWCIGALSIELAASDPQNASLIISGDVNGNPSTGSGQVFTCTENPCTIDLSEGVGNVNYKVDASTGLSDSDSAAYYVDVTTPQIDGSISGTSGTNNWFTTQTLVTASASDFNSGIASLEVNVNNTGYSPYTDTTFTDGVHTIQFRAYDNAGNLTETAIQTIMVDTITPSLSLQVDGTRGQNDFFTSSVIVTPITSDATSGINKIEASVDNGIWTVINSPLFFADGNHSYQIRVTDNAGNVTETPVQTLYIDTSPAVIAMLDDSLMLGDGLFYSIEDSQSGLTELRVVIKDNEGKYKSITWVENLDGGAKFKDSVWWDGIFGDGTYPTSGIYYIALKVINGAGVETIRTATIEVPVIKTAEQENLPPLVLPPSASEETTATPQAVQPSAPQAFGSTSNPFTGNSIQTSFSAKSTTTNSQTTNTTSNVLWGGAAAALLGATLAEWQRQREEEAARLAALRNSGGGDEESGDAADKKRMKVLARVNPAYARSLAQQQSTKAAIAKVTAQEQKAWTRENTLKVESTQAYKDSDNKGQYLKRELQNIRVEEAEYRAEQKAEEQAKIDQMLEVDMTADEKLAAYLQSPEYLAQQAALKAYEEAQRQQALQEYHAGEKNAKAIVEDYEARVREQALQAYRLGEQNAVKIAEDYEARLREQVLQSQRLGERYAVEIAKDYEIRTQSEVKPPTFWESRPKNEERIWWQELRDDVKIWKNQVFMNLTDANLLRDQLVNGLLTGIKTISDWSKIRYFSKNNGIYRIVVDAPAGQKLKFLEEAGFDLLKPGYYTSKNLKESLKETVFPGVKNYFNGIGDNFSDFSKTLKNIWEYGPTAIVDDAGEVIVKQIAEGTVETGAKTIGRELVESALKGGPVDFLVSTAVNIYDYGWGEEKDKGIFSQEFAVSTIVDTTLSILTGIAAAAIVGVFVTASTPAIVIGATVVAVGILLGIGISALGIDTGAKTLINSTIDFIQGEK